MANPKTVYAEDCNYWQTGKASPDTWLEDAKRLIIRAGGKILADGYVNEQGGRSVYMVKFAFGEDVFVASEFVLQSRTGNQLAARRQAATTLYHEIKARCVSVKRRGARWAFLQYLMLPDGQIAGQASTPDLASAWPKMLTVAE
jgi:hypothetical protein